MNLKETLLEKARIQGLAHFYILESNGPFQEAHLTLLNFVQDFIRHYYSEIEGQRNLENILNHPDVFILGETVFESGYDSKDFKVEEAQELIRFFEFRPNQAMRKFAIITDGHRINSTIANKWLKLFEEPQGTSTIFLLNPSRTSLIPTIHSRAVHLRLSAKKPDLNFSRWNEMIKKAKEMTLSQFLEEYPRGETPLSSWVDELIIWESLQFDHSSQKIALENFLKSYQEMETFHQPIATRWALFYSHLKEHVLNR